jgi:DNA-binding XRE family transcriptional regulator
MYQREVAEALDINMWTLINWERGTSEPVWPAHIKSIIGWLRYDPLPKPKTEGEEFRFNRLRKGLTSREAAQAIGVDQGTLLRFENDRSIAPTTRKRLINMLKSIWG